MAQARELIDAHPKGVLDCRIGGDTVRRIDVAAMFMSLWLLTAMVIDVSTPKELTASIIGPVIAPGALALAVLYYKRVPVFDFTVAFATVWMTSWIALELVTPKPLSMFVVVIAAAPLIVMGVIVNAKNWYHRRRRTDAKPASSSS